MAGNRIEYGIDLGTTNSAISRFEKGRVRVIKSERLQKDTSPSCVHYTKRGQLLVGDSAISRLSIDPENTKTEFKRTMGTAVEYSFPNIQKSFSSEELSAEILKMLRSFVKDDELTAAVITVPADFDQVQIQATSRAAELAGFDYCELLQEPIAASLAWLLEEENPGGYWLVFDMGGGTFDAALMNADSGVVRVVDLAGDNYLGGKNIDLLIFDELILPKMREEYTIEGLLADPAKRARLTSVWKKVCEQYKIQLSTDHKVIIEADDPSVIKDDNGNDIDICVTVEREQLDAIMAPLMDRAVSIVRRLLDKNNLTASDLRTVLLVGGPTMMPYVRQRVQKEISDNINVTIDPMTAVAAGAALYASTRTIPANIRKVDAAKIQLNVTHPETTVKESVSLKIAIDEERTTSVIPSEISVTLSRADGAWNSVKTVLTAEESEIELSLATGSTNIFNIELNDSKGRRVLCEPAIISVLQGIEISNPPLPHDICVEAESEELGHISVPLLLKGQKLPAAGKKSFKTKTMLRAGTPEDIFSIIVREGEMNTRPVRNVMVGAISITGSELTRTVAKGSDVEITIKMDESRRVAVTAYFPDTDETIHNALETSYRIALIEEAHFEEEVQNEAIRLADLKKRSEASGNPFEDILSLAEVQIKDISHLHKTRTGDEDSSFALRNRLNELQIRLDDLENKLEWKQAEFNLNETYKHARKIVEIFGNDEHKRHLANVCEQMDEALKNRDTAKVGAVTVSFSEIRNNILIEQPGFWISILNNICSTFQRIKWTNQEQAELLKDKGKLLLDSDFSLRDVQKIVRDLWNLMTPEEKKRTQKVRPDIPLYKV
ncbi:MAG: Hsp70 family protein [Fibrobacteres bacterium]|nr:Hsp70 family protein [Fibrobacterota bacterium]